MNDATDFDLIILGGGMTGLTLGYHLSRSNVLHAENEQRTLILEPRNNYTRDKT